MRWLLVIPHSSNSRSLRRTSGMGKMESPSCGLTPRALALFDLGVLPVPRIQHQILHDRDGTLPLHCAPSAGKIPIQS
jgi:hypothetical protein